MTALALWVLALAALGVGPCWAAQIAATSFPPEDLDGSGDDDDNFSGSGNGPMPGVSVIELSLPTRTNTLLASVSAVSTTYPPIHEEERSTGATLTSPSTEEDNERPLVLSEHTHESSYPDEGTTTGPAKGTTGHPTTQHPSTIKVTTTRLASTVRNTDLPSSRRQNASHIFPGVFDSTLERGSEGAVTASASPEMASETMTPFAETEGSGDTSDFHFVGPSEPPVVEVQPDPRKETPVDKGATGAAQGILDRKEVLGGVIAGGLVGLLFAMFLVGFMLYRMKKKDEGSYSLDEPKQANGGYQKPQKQEEFYA
ncbi:syndecan-1 [Tachyglossus aculeatus]|uniref:syndecan-1 n=1 Tax=Tachyglossus aculeatus TaxID=9261 RepID=UPI0018F2A00E|nr:syndecan-1 [Tachyglossus aculeatus]